MRENRTIRAKRVSSAASVVRQLNAEDGSKDRAHPLFPVNLLESGRRDDGRPTLRALIRTDVGETQALDLSFLLTQSELMPLFAQAILLWAPTRSIRTRVGLVYTLRNGLFSYLDSCYAGVELTPPDLNDELFTGYREWLFARRVRGKPLHPNSIKNYLGCPRILLSVIDKGPWAESAQSIAQRVPRGPFGAARRASPLEVISASSLVAIIDACEEELEEIASRLDYGGVLISEGKRAIEEGHTDLKNVSVCLAMLAAKYPNMLPTLEDIGKENRSLGYAATEHGARTLASYLYSSPRDLVPLVILLTIATVFNPDTVLRLKWSAIDRNFLRLGLRGIRVIGEKARAKKDLVRLLDPSASISRKFCFDYLLDLLERITSRIRPVCEKKDRDRVFVFVPKVGQKRVISFTDDTLRSSGWRPKLQEFIADNRLPNFTLGQIRPTIIDMVQQFDGGLEAARAVGNHSRMSTTWTHYTSDGARKRNREKVGEVILLRERWINTQGKIDPRRLTNTDDRAAATPGFRCLDPFDSPSPGQRSGVLCKDYGGCPTCPLAVARPNDAISVAYYLALKSSLLASQVQMSGNSWSCRWAPRLSALNNLLNMVPEQIMSKALRFHISLPQVG